jgi:PAS domain S-box-containing protein
MFRLDTFLQWFAQHQPQNTTQPIDQSVAVDAFGHSNTEFVGTLNGNSSDPQLPNGQHIHLQPSLLQDLLGQLYALHQTAIVSETDLYGNIIFVNDTFCTVSKYTKEELLGQNHRMLKSGQQAEELFVVLWQTVSAGETWKGLIKNRAKDGSFYWIEMTITPFLDATYKPYKYVSVNFDITQQVQQQQELYKAYQRISVAEQELVLKEDEQERLFKYARTAQLELNGRISALNNAALVSETDIEGNITFANPNFCKLSQYELIELLGANHRILKSGFHPDAMFEELWQTISTGKPWRGKIKNRAKDGSHYWVQTAITPILDHDNKPYKYISVRFNITKELQQQQDLYQSNQQLAYTQEELRQNVEELSVFNEALTYAQLELKGQISALNDAAIVSEANLAGKIIFINDTFCEISKYRREELMGQNHRILKSGDQPDALFEDLWRTISSGKAWKGLIKNRAKDGSCYWVQTSITPILDQDGKPYKYVSVRFEVTLMVEAALV